MFLPNELYSGFNSLKSCGFLVSKCKSLDFITTKFNGEYAHCHTINLTHIDTDQP